MGCVVTWNCSDTADPVVATLLLATLLWATLRRSIALL